MKRLVLIIFIVCFGLNSFSQKINEKEYKYFYRIDLGDTEPSYFPEYINKVPKDSIITVELEIIYKDDEDTAKIFEFDDPRLFLRVYQDEQMLEGFEKEGRYYVNINKNKAVKFRYSNTRKGKLEKELYSANLDYIREGYQLNKIIIEEGKSFFDIIPLIWSKRPLSENEISEIIKLLKTNHYKVEELEIFKNKTAILLYEI